MPLPDVKLDGTNETSGFQWIAFVPMMPCREGDAASRAGLAFKEPLWPGFEALAFPFDVWRKFFIADETVDPAVCDFNADVVVACFHNACGVDAERRFPEDAAVAAVDEDAGVVMDFAEIEHEGDVGIFRRKIDGFRVSGCAGEETDSRLLAVGEGDEFGEDCLFGGTEIWREGYVPWAVEGDRFGDVGGVEAVEFAIRVCDGERAVLPCGQDDVAVHGGDIVIRLVDGIGWNDDGSIFRERLRGILSIQRVFHDEMLEMEHGGIAAESVIGGDGVENSVLRDKTLDMGGDVFRCEAVVCAINCLADD